MGQERSAHAQKIVRIPPVWSSFPPVHPPEDPPYSLTFDEEHGAYYGRWYCRLCEESGVDERAQGDEASAVVAARTLYERTHRKHSRRSR